MTRTLLALSLACALSATPVFATVTSDGTAPTGTDADRPPDGTRNKQVQQLEAVDVSASLDQARNALSPQTGST